MRAAVGVAATALLLGVATACEPPPPPPSLVVTTTTAGPDALPGDGVCEITAGAGDCSFQAAIQEGNALGRADIHLAAANYTIPAITVTGDLSVTGSGTHLGATFTTFSGGLIDVAAGGRLSLDNVTTMAQFLVHGGLAVRHSYLFWLSGPEWTGPHVQVMPGGTALFQNTILPGALGVTALYNGGVTILHHSTLFVSPDGSGLALDNQGTVHSFASYVERCSGLSLDSHGYNADANGSCGLDDPTDVPSATGLAISGSFRWYFYMYSLRSDSPLLDAVPEGVNGCGTNVTDDMEHRARPFDGDGDGTAQCDIGALEETPSVP